MRGVDVAERGGVSREVRLWDSQWVSVVNHADCYRGMDKEDAVATAVRMTERLMRENITQGFPPADYNRAAVAELVAANRAMRFDAYEATTPEMLAVFGMRKVVVVQDFAMLERVRVALSAFGGSDGP